ncbi:hypothetical protein Hte_005356 [Hypoxylon texense]
MSSMDSQQDTTTAPPATEENLAVLSSQTSLDGRPRVGTNMEHITQKHTRPHKCPQCSRRFGTAKDRDRHAVTIDKDTVLRPLESWVCHEASCRRNGKPFSRRDNYLKHLREVHGKQGQGSEGAERRPSSSENSYEPESRDNDVAAVGGADCFGGGPSKGKRKASVLNEGLDDLSRDDLIHLLMKERQRSQGLEDELKLYRKREDVHLGILTARFKDT